MGHHAGRFGLMDSLRAIAALSIVAYHVAPRAGALDSELALDISAQLSSGVALFFLISGFLLYRPFVVAHTEGERFPDVRAYAWRRFLRIVPAYWVALTVTGLLIAPEVFERPLLFYGFAQVYSPGAVFEGIPVAWTLCIEVSFYAFLPLYALAVRGAGGLARASAWRVETTALIALFLLGLSWRTAGTYADGELVHTSLNTLPAYLDWFAVGMGLAVLSAWLATGAPTPAAVRLVERTPGVAWALGAAALAANAWFWERRYFGLERSGDLPIVGVHVTELICAFGFILPAIFVGAGGGSVRRVLAWPVLLWLGMVSYGIYLWQAAAIDVVAEVTPLGNDFTDPSLWWVPAGFGACIAAGALSWYLLERPVLSLRRLVPPRGAATAAARQAEAATTRVAP